MRLEGEPESAMMEMIRGALKKSEHQVKMSSSSSSDELTKK